MDSAETAHESSLGAAGIFLGIVLIGIAVVGVLRLRSSELNPAETLGRKIQWSALPFGFELESAAQLPELSISSKEGLLFPPGKQVVRLVDPARPDALAELVAKPEPKADWDEGGEQASGDADGGDGDGDSDHDGDGDSGERETEGGEEHADNEERAEASGEHRDSDAESSKAEHSDSSSSSDAEKSGAGWGASGSKSESGGGWGEPVVALPSEAPLEALFVLFPSPDGVTDTFGRSNFSGWGGGGGGRGRGRGGRSSMGGGGFSFGGPTVLDKGDLTWGNFNVGFVLERDTSDGLRDEMRINLSREGFYCILVLRWAKGEAGTIEQAEGFLSAFQFRADAFPN